MSKRDMLHRMALATLAALTAFAVLPSSSAAQRSIRVMSPNGGETTTAGTPLEITWSATGFDGDERVEIEYSVDGGGDWNGIDKVEASTGRFTWIVRNRPSESALIRVMSRDESVIDESDGYFTIEEDPLEMTILFTPNGGEEWHAGDTQTIAWQAPADAINVLLELSLDFGITWQEIGTRPATPGTMSYVVPHLSDQVITSAVVRVSVAEALDHFDISDAPFEVKPEEDNGGGDDDGEDDGNDDGGDGGDGNAEATLSLLYPNGGEVFSEDSVVIIEWESTNIPGRLEIEYSIDGGITWEKIDREDAAAGQVDWRVPGEETAQGMIRIRREDGSIEDISDSPFSIDLLPLEQTVLITPQQGESWRQGDTARISWSAPADMVTALLEYSLDGGTDWTPIRILPAADALYDWAVPIIADTAIPGALIRIVDIEHAGRETTSGPITLLPKQSVSGVTHREEGIIGLSPNPAASTTTLHLGDRPALVRIVGVDGRLLREFSASGEEVIDLSRFTTGLYVVMVRSGDHERHFRLVVVR